MRVPPTRAASAGSTSTRAASWRRRSAALDRHRPELELPVRLVPFDRSEKELRPGEGDVRDPLVGNQRRLRGLPRPGLGPSRLDQGRRRDYSGRKEKPRLRAAPRPTRRRDMDGKSRGDRRSLAPARRRPERAQGRTRLRRLPFTPRAVLRRPERRAALLRRLPSLDAGAGPLLSGRPAARRGL